MTHSLRLCLLLCLLTVAGRADPSTTHTALAELFFPPQAWKEQGDLLCQDSLPWAWDTLPAATWSELEPLSKLPLNQRRLAFAQLGRKAESAPLHLAVRRFYLGWYYQGARGRRHAQLPPSQRARGTLQPPALPDSPLTVKQNEIEWRGAEIDVLIVGSGPAGSVLGYELSRAGFKTVLVERGSFVLPGQLDTRTVPELKVGGGAVPTVNGGMLVRNGEAVGGGSTVNVDLAFAPTLPFVESRFQSWRRRGLIAADQWTPAEMERAYRWVVEKIGTRQPGLEEINGNNAVLWDGEAYLGLRPELYDLNTSRGLPEHINKSASVKTLLLKAMERESNPLVVIPDLDVRSVLHQDGVALGVEAIKERPWQDPAVLTDPAQLDLNEGQTYLLKARQIVLCAGAQGSAALLLRSQLGGEQVGQGVVLHPSMPLIGLFDRPINALEGTASTVYVVDDRDPGLLYECMTDEPAYVAMMLFGNGQEIAHRVERFQHLSGFGVLLVDSVRAENRVTLNSEGEASVEYHLTPQDKARFRQGVRRAASIMLAAGAREVYLPSCELTAPQTEPGDLVKLRSYQDLALIEQLEFQPARTVVTSAHMQSTCKMGEVVDQNHLVRGMENLYVCDSSVFPGSVGANPMQTIYTVAKLFSEQMISWRTSGVVGSRRLRAP